MAEGGSKDGGALDEGEGFAVGGTLQLQGEGLKGAGRLACGGVRPAAHHHVKTHRHIAHGRVQHALAHQPVCQVPCPCHLHHTPPCHSTLPLQMPFHDTAHSPVETLTLRPYPPPPQSTTLFLDISLLPCRLHQYRSYVHSNQNKSSSRIKVLEDKQCTDTDASSSLCFTVVRSLQARLSVGKVRHQRTSREVCRVTPRRP